MNRTRKSIIEQNWISEVVTLPLGGYDQQIMLEGKSRDLPILVVLHGGPGSPIPFNVGCRGLFPDVTDKCIMVCWDQYGCGVNNAELSEHISIDDFVNMTSDLIDNLKARFPDNKLYIFGMSWGSVLSARVANKRSESLDGVFTYGQVLHDLLRTEDTVEAIMGSRAPEKVKREVRRIVKEEDGSFEAVMKMTRYVRKYTFGYTNPREPKSPLGKIMLGLLTSPDYRFADFMAMVKNGYMKNKSLIKELKDTDLRDDLKNISIPYHVIQGDTDIVTSTKAVKIFVDELQHENVTCVVVQDSAHMPGMNGMRMIMEEIERL